MKNILNKKLIIIVSLGIVLLCIIAYLSINISPPKYTDDIVLNIEPTTIKKMDEKKFIDIKGYVKKPGVYEFKENDRVIDAINMAGGLKKNANTDNINLSEKLKSEMVIYVYSDSEIKKDNKVLSCDTICQTKVIEVNNCIDSSPIEIKNNSLININTATLIELQTLSGIGESKAKNIIEYRETNGGFKSIEELKNISGIGEALYEKIKDKISI